MFDQYFFLSSCCKRVKLHRMSFPAQFTKRNFSDEDHYRQVLSAGIGAVKAGDLEQARTLLQKAAEIKPTDPQPWLWLSATTDKPEEQRDYLEYALAADPNNGAARRGLAILSGKLDTSRLLAEGQEVVPRQPQAPLEAMAEKVFLCEQCGGRLSLDVARQRLVCGYCGHEQAMSTVSVADEAELTLDFVLPTTRGHVWAEAQHRFCCNQCGAISVLAVMERALVCPHCGSSQMIESEETVEMLSPNVLLPPRLTVQEASQQVGEWLGRGLFIPDDLKKMAKPSALRPVYYPFWTFDGILQMNWVCEVNRSNSDTPYWEVERGVEFEIFDDVVVPGVKALNCAEISQTQPFDLKAVVAYDPAYLANWNVLTYDHPLADASLDAREIVVRRLRQALPSRVQVGTERRNLQSGETNWSGLTYKLVLLPFYVGSYHYRGKNYQLYVNAHNGKVGGVKPVDTLKRAAFWLLVGLSVVVLIVAIFALGLSFGWFRF